MIVITKLRWPSALLFIFLTSTLHAAIPEVDFAPAQAWITPVEVPKTDGSSGDGSVNYLLVDNQFNIRQQKQIYFQYAMQPVSESGLVDISQVEIGFSPRYEKLTVHAIEVIRDGQVLNKLSPEDMKLFQQETELNDKLYTERWVAMFILEDIRVGDVISYRYTISGSNPVFGETLFGASALNWSIPLEQSYFRLVTRRDQNVEFKFHNISASMQQIDVEDGREYIVNQRDIAPVREDDFVPNWFTPYGYLTFSEYESWAHLNQWAFDLYDVDLALPDELRAIIEQNKGADKAATVAAMIQWVQDNIRYFGVEMGVNSHMPSTPQETFSRRYGDCKDKTMLLVAVLNYLGVQAHPVLVSTTLSKLLPEQIATPGVFDHVILTFNLAGKDYWVDATMTNQRGDLTEMAYPHLYWGLVVKPNTNSLTAIEAIAPSQVRGGLSEHQTLLVSEGDQPLSLAVATTYTGWKAEQFRSYIKNVGEQAGTKDHLDYYAKYYPGASEASQIEVAHDLTGNRMGVSERYLIDNPYDKIKGKRRLMLYANAILDSIWLPEKRQRSAPFVLPYFIDIDVTINVDISSAPELYWLEEETFEVDANPWFDYQRSVVKDDGQITVHFEYHSKVAEVAANDFAEYAKLLNGIEDTLSVAVIFEAETGADNTARARSLVKQLLKKNKGN